jgi:hypothetical protein
MPQVPCGGGCPAADAWLEVLPKVPNTQVVLLADNGLAASQKSLTVACQVYRCTATLGVVTRRCLVTFGRNVLCCCCLAEPGSGLPNVQVRSNARHGVVTR